VLTQAGYASGGSTALSDAGNSILSSSAYMGRIYNCKLFMTTTVAVDSANDAVGGIFSPEAFGHVIKRPIVVREQYDASLRSTEYVATTARGNEILVDKYACKIKSEAVVD